MGSELRFEEPPVREVSLTVFFERIAALQALNLAQLRVNWKESYPKVSEVPPRPPFRGNAPIREYLGGNSFWPMPFTAFTNARGNQTIELQNDRFGIVWRFDQGPKAYPGYEELSRELLLRFSEFQEAIAESIAQDLEPTEAYVVYNNLIEGYSPEDLATGILTDWQVGSAQVGSPELAGLRLHYCSPEPNGEVSVTISVDPTFDRDREEGSRSASLELEGFISLEAPVNIAQSLSTVHDAIVDKFMAITSRDIKAKWGFRREDA